MWLSSTKMFEKREKEKMKKEKTTKNVEKVPT